MVPKVQEAQFGPLFSLFGVVEGVVVVSQQQNEGVVNCFIRAKRDLMVDASGLGKLGHIRTFERERYAFFPNA